MQRFSIGLGITLVGLAAALTAACGGAAPSPAGPSTAANPAALGARTQGQPAEVEPKRGGTIIIGQRDTPETMNYYAGAFASQIVFRHFYETLVTYDFSKDWRIDFPVIPGLAAGWETPDDKTYVLKVREGVKWHDGTPLTAEGVVWSLEYARDPKNNFAVRGNLAGVDSITVEPGEKVRITLQKAAPNFLVRLQGVKILPKHIFDAGGADALGTKSVGTGPFQFVSMDRTSRTTFKRFDSYWNKDAKGRQLPFMDGMQWVHSMDAATQQAAFAAGQIDLLPFSDKAQMDSFLKRVSNAKVHPFWYSSDPALAVNIKRPYMDKLEVRKALNLIINRQQIADNFAAGEALLSLPVVPAIKEGYAIPQDELVKRPGWRPDKKEDLAEARRLLDQAGVPKDWELVVLNRATLGNGPQVEMAANQFKEFGLNVKYVPLDDATFLREQRGPNWDLSVLLMANADITAGAQQFVTNAASNFGKISDPALDAAFDKLVSTADIAEQKKLAREIQEIILTNHYNYPLVTPAIYILEQPWLNGWRHNYGIQIYLESSAEFMWIDTDKLPSNRR